MSTGELSADVREMLMGVSTATVCTALFKKGLRNQFIQDVGPVSLKNKNMVGQAYTLRYIPAREDLNPISIFQESSHPQRAGVEECPPGHVMVIDSRKDSRAASAGSILVARMMQRGVAGVVTDGGFRDAPIIGELDIPCYHNQPTAPTNLTLHQAIELNGPIGCGDAPVFPGDVIVGDGDGVVVVPLHMAEEIAIESKEMTVFEDFVTEQVMEGRPVIGLYPATTDEAKADYAAWRKRTGR